MENNSLTKMEERDEEAEETLSFCDLPLYSTDSDLSLQSYPSRSDDTFFEFSISDNSSDHLAENFQFFKKSISLKTEKNTKNNPYSDTCPKRVYRKTGSLHDFFVSDGLSDQSDQNCHFLKHSITQKTGNNTKLNPYSGNWAKRVYGETNILLQRGTAEPANSRWPLLMFGPPKTPTSRRSSGGVSERNMKREKKMWGVIKALGCGGAHLAVA